jgi:ABC-type glutathione transport system ATPase component
MMDEILLQVRNLEVSYPATGRRSGGLLTAVHQVSFDIRAGTIFGLVGESGSGKSSLAHSIVRLHGPTSGQVLFRGADLSALNGGELRQARRKIQVIFQDPLASLSPRRTIAQSLREPLDHFRIGQPDSRHAAICDALNAVGLEPGILDQYPHEISGGQRQRVADHQPGAVTS